MQFGVGIVSLAIAVTLLYLGRPDKNGKSPPFLQFGAALVLYPPLVLVFCAFGLVEVIYSVL